MEITWKRYLKTMNELDKIKQNGMYGYYITDKDDNIVGEVPDGRCFDQKTFEEQVVKTNSKYSLYFLPDKIRDQVRQEWSRRSRAELDGRINKLRFIQNQGKNKFLLRHKVELDELLQIQEIDRASVAIEEYCKSANPVIRYQEFFRIEDLRKCLSRFIKKAEENPKLRKIQSNRPVQHLLEFNDY